MFWPEILPFVHLIVEKTLSASRETSPISDVEKTLSASRETSPISDGLLSAIDLLVVFPTTSLSTS